MLAVAHDHVLCWTRSGSRFGFEVEALGLKWSNHRFQVCEQEVEEANNADDGVLLQERLVEWIERIIRCGRYQWLACWVESSVIATVKRLSGRLDVKVGFLVF